MNLITSLFTHYDPKQLVHIVLSTLAFSVLFLAALQAVLLALQEWQLHHRRLQGLVQALPPLQTMERFLFQLVSLGFVLFTLLLLTSILFFQQIFAVPLLQKTLISILAWLIFAVLLMGRKRFGWRGRTAIQWTLSGVVLLTLLYFGF